MSATDSDFPNITEPEIVAARQDFNDAQRWLAGATSSQATLTVGWFGTSMIVTRGCFAVVNLGQDNVAELVGEILKISKGGRSVYVYCVARTGLPQEPVKWDIAISRRAFLALSLLTKSEITGALVETVI